jgi:glycosyltransferase involved in cell wall biosynthesis
MKVSIALTVFNNAHSIKQTLQSIFAQTLTDWELIIIDDGSTDGSVEILRQINDPRVRLVIGTENRKSPYRLNQTSEMAQGQYLARIDADDLMCPERLERQCQYLDANPEIDICGTSIYLIDYNTELKGFYAQPTDMKFGLNMIRTSLYFQPSVMAKASWYKKNKYDLRYIRAQDMEFWCRMAMEKNTNFGAMADCLTFYRKTEVNTLTKTLRTLRLQRQICWEYGPRLSNWLTTSAMLTELVFKLQMHQLTDKLGIRRLLIRSKDDSMSPEEILKAQNDIQIILSTPVPGLEGVQKLALAG